MRRHHGHPASRASIAGAVAGIVLIALAVGTLVPVAMNWPESWPGVLVALALGAIGVAMVVRHMSHHRVGGVDGPG